MFSNKGRATLSALVTLSALTTLCDSEELCEPWKRVKIHNGKLFPNNSVWDTDNQILYPPKSYWKGGVDTQNAKFYGCPCNLDKPCMRKCCQKNETMDYETLECIPYNAAWPWFRPSVPADEEGNFRMEHFDYFGLTFGNYCRGYRLEPDLYPEEDQFFVNFTDGTLSLPLFNMTGLGPDWFCIEYFAENNTYLPYVCSRNLGIKDPPPDRCGKLRYIFYPIGMIISTLFLILSLCIYTLIPELRHFHGKCLMCHMISLLSAYICLATVQGIGWLLSNDVCIIFGFMIYFSLLCTFFWLNIMCIDICLAFRSMLPINTFHGREMKKFLLYMLYAWGIPLAIIMITAIIELHPGVPSNIYKPNFKKTCWFESEESRMIYFKGPVGVIILCNTILFLITAYKIYELKMKTKILTERENARHSNEEDGNRFKLYIKLSIVMGINWAMDIISSLVGGSKCIWLFTDTLNTLQGLFIFLIFVNKKKVCHMIKMRFCSNSVSDTAMENECDSTVDTCPSMPSSNVHSTSDNGGGNCLSITKNANGTKKNDKILPTKQEITRL